MRHIQSIGVALAVVVSLPGLLLAMLVIYSKLIFLRLPFDASNAVWIMLLYATYASGVVVGLIGILRGPRPQIGKRNWAIGVLTAIAGVIASILLEIAFWNDTTPIVPRGYLFATAIFWVMSFFTMTKPVA